MYARTKKFTNKDGSTRIYVQIVVNKRHGDKVRQKVIANLGRLKDLQQKPLEQLIGSLARYSVHQWTRFTPEKLKTKRAGEWGPALIFGSLWKKLGLEKILEQVMSDTQATSDYALATFAMVLNRLSDPQSKRGVNKWVEKIYHPGMPSLQLHHYYRALDYLAKHKNEIEERLFDTVRTLFNLDLDLVFWDTTSTYFEGNGPEIAQLGHSKDHRPDRKQLVVGVLMTRDGFPVAHEVFPGNMADIKTFRHCIKQVQQRFNLGRVILVADRGMVSKDLLEEITSAGLSYIVGMKMRSVRTLREVLSRGGRYQEVSENLQVKQVYHEDNRYVVCFNPQQARRDEQSRQQMVDKLKERLKKGSGSLIGNRGYRRYVKVSGSAIQLDEKRIAEQSRYDGKYVLRTNTRLSSSEVAGAYKSLWQIERAFRELKTGLNLRPIHLWTEQRVRGHIMMCFLALVIESALCRKLKEVNSPCCYNDVIEDLKELRAVEIDLDGERYLSRTEMPGHAYEAFKALKLRPPKHIQQIE